jgi:hypothetical protein
MIVEYDDNTGQILMVYKGNYDLEKNNAIGKERNYIEVPEQKLEGKKVDLQQEKIVEK